MTFVSKRAWVRSLRSSSEAFLFCWTTTQSVAVFGMWCGRSPKGRCLAIHVLRMPDSDRTRVAAAWVQGRHCPEWPTWRWRPVASVAASARALLDMPTRNVGATPDGSVVAVGGLALGRPSSSSAPSCRCPSAGARPHFLKLLLEDREHCDSRNAGPDEAREYHSEARFVTPAGRADFRPNPVFDASIGTDSTCFRHDFDISPLLSRRM